MPTLRQLSQASSPSQRRYRRFALHFPVQVKFSLGNSVSELQTLSRNLSIGGMLLEASTPIPENAPITFTILVNARKTARPVQLVGKGKVVHVYDKNPDGRFAIAVQCSRPITEMRQRLAAAGY